MSPLNITQPWMVYGLLDGYYKVMSNIPKMGQLPTPVPKYTHAHQPNFFSWYETSAKWPSKIESKIHKWWFGIDLQKRNHPRKHIPSGNLTQLLKIQHLWWIYPFKMVIFYSHVSLPECNLQAADPWIEPSNPRADQGWGLHIEAAMKGIPMEERCPGWQSGQCNQAGRRCRRGLATVKTLGVKNDEHMVMMVVVYGGLM